MARKIIARAVPSVKTKEESAGRKTKDEGRKRIRLSSFVFHPSFSAQPGDTLLLQVVWHADHDHALAEQQRGLQHQRGLVV